MVTVVWCGGCGVMVVVWCGGCGVVWLQWWWRGVVTVVVAWCGYSGGGGVLRVGDADCFTQTFGNFETVSRLRLVGSDQIR